DNAELVRAAVDLLRADPELLDAERRRASYVYVDEFADTDPAQVDLLELVSGGGGNVVAFADPDSSIYGFRGSDPSAVADFADRFAPPSGARPSGARPSGARPSGARPSGARPSGAPAPVVVLTRTHRSAGDLLDATRRVASRLRGPGRQRSLVAADDLASG